MSGDIGGAMGIEKEWLAIGCVAANTGPASAPFDVGGDTCLSDGGHARKEQLIHAAGIGHEGLHRAVSGHGTAHKKPIWAFDEDASIESRVA